GDDFLFAGTHTSQLFGGNGKDIFNWQVGNSDTTFDGGPGTDDKLVLSGSDDPDTFILTKLGQQVQVLAPAATLMVTNIETIDIESGLGADTVTVNDILLPPNPGNGNGVNEVDINLDQLANPDGAIASITVNGTAAAD